MQRLINVVALLSGLISLGLIGGGVYVYLQKDALIEGVKKEVVNAAITGVAGALPGMLDAAMPEIPEVTGSAIPETKVTGPAVPS